MGNMDSEAIKKMTIADFEDLIADLNKEGLLAKDVSIADRFKKPDTYRNPIECLEREYVKPGECKVLVRR